MRRTGEARRWGPAGCVLLALVAAGCAMPESVRRGDTAHARGDTAQATALYEKALQDTYLTPDEYAHVARRLEDAAEAELTRRLEELEERHRASPAAEALTALNALRAEKVGRWWTEAQERQVVEARRRVLARNWPVVEELTRQGHSRAALGRAQELAVFFPREEPVWEEVRRLEAALRAYPVQPLPPGRTRFSPRVDDHLRAMEAALQRGNASAAQREFVLALAMSGQPFKEFMNGVIATYGLNLPYLETPLPPRPALPEGVQVSSTWSRTYRGGQGMAYARGPSVPPEHTLAANGFWTTVIGGEVLLLDLPDLPTQPDRQGAYVGERLEMPMLAHALSGWGWTVQDTVMAEFFLGGRLSPAHEYPRRSEREELQRETGFCYGGVLAYRLLVGYRGQNVGLMVGARPQYTGYQVGDVTASGTMLPLEARLELRWSVRYPLILHGWFTPSDAEHGTKGLMLHMPVSARATLIGRYESLKLSTRMGGLKRDDRIDLGSQGSSLFTLGVGYGF